MTPEMKAKWVEALRSGKYKQGRGSLKFTDSDGTHYCCLGVLCEVAGLKQKAQKAQYGRGRSEQYYFSLHDDADPSIWASQFIPDHFKLGISQNDQYELAANNDRGMPFNTIADMIENSSVLEMNDFPA